MESQDGGASSSSSSSHHAKTSSSKLKHHHHHHQYFQPTQFPPIDPPAVTPPPSSSIRPPHFLPHQNHHPNSHDRSYRPTHRSRDFLPGNSYPHPNRSYTNNNSRYTNFGGGLGLNHQNHNHNVNLYASSPSQFELQHTNSYNGYNDDWVQHNANQQFEWQLRSNSHTVGNFDNGQQYGRGDGNQWRGGNSSSGNIRRNFHQNVTNNGDLQGPGLTDQLDPVKAVQDHMNMSMKSVHENKVQKYVDKKKAQQSYKKLGVSGQLDIPRPGIRSNLCSVQPHCTVESLLNLQVKDDKIANKDGSDKKAKMPTGNCGHSDTKEGQRFGATMQKEKDKCGAIDKKKGQRFSEKKLRVSRQLPHSGPVVGCNHDTGKAPGIKQSLVNLLVEDDKSAIELASDKEDYMPMGVWKHNHKKNGFRCEEKNSERGPLPLSNIHSVTASGVEESLLNLQAEIEEMAIEHFDHNEMSKVSKHFDKKKSLRVYDEMFGASSCPEPVLGIDPFSVKPTCTEESFLNLHAENAQIANQPRYNKQDQMKKDNHKSNITNEKKKGQNLHDKVQMNKNSAASNGTNVKKKDQKSHQKKGVKEPRKKYIKTDARGMGLLSQDVRKSLSQMICRGDIDMLITPFLATYESLIPAEEEKSKQKQLYTLLERLVGEQWPEAHLYLYGSSANSFAASMSDIDVCLRLDDPEINKSNILLRLADILQSDNFQNVKALPLTRVPVVKFLDPLTGISCDLCMNNVLSVENTKLLRDYAEIDVRLRQLVFIVKHWAKSRGVNETYEGTLSSYAYALMCIHFLQQRKPAILPCLQEMEITYSVTVDGFQCAYFDQVEELRCFGSNNKENIAELVWAFFAYWAYCHDYNNTVISVRTRGIISKQSKQWTTNIGKDRHFISIEDPFETSHDLGRVIHRFTLKVMRVEFERAAHIMQWDPNACVNLFIPYVTDGPLRRA